MLKKEGRLSLMICLLYKICHRPSDAKGSCLVSVHLPRRVYSTRQYRNVGMVFPFCHTVTSSAYPAAEPKAHVITKIQSREDPPTGIKPPAYPNPFVPLVTASHTVCPQISDSRIFSIQSTKYHSCSMYYLPPCAYSRALYGQMIFTCFPRKSA